MILLEKKTKSEKEADGKIISKCQYFETLERVFDGLANLFFNK